MRGSGGGGRVGSVLRESSGEGGISNAKASMYLLAQLPVRQTPEQPETEWSLPRGMIIFLMMDTTPHHLYRSSQTSLA